MNKAYLAEHDVIANKVIGSDWTAAKNNENELFIVVCGEGESGKISIGPDSQTDMWTYYHKRGMMGPDDVHEEVHLKMVAKVEETFRKAGFIR